MKDSWLLVLAGKALYCEEGYSNVGAGIGLLTHSGSGYVMLVYYGWRDIHLYTSSISGSSVRQKAHANFLFSIF